MGWQDSLPREVRQALEVDPESLGDFSSAVARLDALSNLATRRAIEAVAPEMRPKEEVVELGDTVEPPSNEKVHQLDDKEISLRLDVAVRATKELVKAKKERLTAQDLYQGKAEDVPQKQRVEIHVRHVHPVRRLAALKRLKRFDEAAAYAREAGISYDADETWGQQQTEEETA